MSQQSEASEAMASLLAHIAHEDAPFGRSDVQVTGDRFGCGAADQRERRACALFLWLLGPTTEQLATTCPCKEQ